MKSDGSSNHVDEIFSEWENNILFDADDPDFGNSMNSNGSFTLKQVSTTMSLANVQNVHYANSVDLCSSAMGKSTINVTSSSYSDLINEPYDLSTDSVLSIEELRAQIGSCFTCGVSWYDEHVSLDCSECGGYSIERPCPLCDGKCGVLWKRDYTMSHASSKARWQGVCSNFPDIIYHNLLPANYRQAIAAMHAKLPTVPSNQQNCGTSQFLAQELCARLEQLSSAGADKHTHTHTHTQLLFFRR